ncbi:MAG: flagellar basal body-associated FliL family protein [Alphaproteobacteria bacterium]|nr:flagellar basal body-associated FliL family protein [Alphaproteobacteria bacterium]MBF0130026.1 flagellar basal body-associated FliL family protein [Alphaproteobacteria bacterium]
MGEDVDEDLDDDGDVSGGDSPERSSSAGMSPAKKKLVMIALAVVFLLVSLGGAFFMGLMDPLFALFGGGEKQDHGEQMAEEHGGPPVFLDLPEMLVNLNSTGRKKVFLKIRVKVEISNIAAQPMIEELTPRIVDNFQVYLRELRLEDLQGASGMYRLREELLNRVNTAIKPAKVNDVLFQEMLVQ